MAAETLAATRQRDVRARLDRVTDPELDEPVTDLGFVTAVDVDAGHVHVRFRLPTYWCAANFAFLMADDMRREVGALPWVERVSVELGEHMYAETINRGLRDGRSFGDTFGAEAENGGLDAVRRTFARKSYQRRQEQVMQHLLRAGHAADALVALTVGELRSLPAALGVGVAIGRYLDRREVPGPFDDHDLAFVDADGRPIQAAEVDIYLRKLRNVAVNIEFNGVLCRGLLAARFDEEQPCDDGPTLGDFMRQAASAAR